MSDLSELLTNVKSAPQTAAHWDALEKAAAKADSPDTVLVAYREILAGRIEPAIADAIGQRASAFCAEWFGDEPASEIALLRRVLELSPGSEHALARIAVLYTSGEQWKELLGVYDTAIAAARVNDQKLKLLREAADLAKDVANRPDKAISYLQALLRAQPDDALVAQNLERLLERHERWSELATLWDSRLAGLQRKEREAARAKIADLCLTSLRDPARALATLRPLFSDADDDTQACALLERIITSPDASRATRDQALDVLRAHYDATDRARRVVDVLEQVIAKDPEGTKALREEAGARLAELADESAAIVHYAALLALTPESLSVQEKLRDLTSRTGTQLAYAMGVAQAARAAAEPSRRIELLVEAARVQTDQLAAPEEAIALYREALAQDGASDKERLEVSRKLNELYQSVPRPRERLDVLVALAELETGPARRAILADSARLAESIDDIDLALSLWAKCVADNPRDLIALDQQIQLLEQHERWDGLVAALHARASLEVPLAQQRADRVRVAHLHALRRGDLESAITEWQRLARDMGEDAESVAALTELYEATSRFPALAQLLERANSADTARSLDRINRLAHTLWHKLDQPERAVAVFASALAIAPTDNQAQASLRELLAFEATRRDAAAALADAYARTNNDAGVLTLLSARLADARSTRERAGLLREAAAIAARQGDAEAALAHTAQAFVLTPQDASIGEQLRQLAATTGNYRALAAALAEGASALGAQAKEAARLDVERADLLAARLGEPNEALQVLLHATDILTGDATATELGVRVAAERAAWETAALLLVRYAAQTDLVADAWLTVAEQAAHKHGAEATLAEALAHALDQMTVSSGVAATLRARAATLFERGAAPERAMTQYRFALAKGGPRLAWLRALAELERKAGSWIGLADSLTQLRDADAADLGTAIEAAEVTQKLGAPDKTLAAFQALATRLRAAWRSGAALPDERSYPELTSWAYTTLADQQLLLQQPATAVDTLMEAAQLPLDAATKRTLRLRAADLAASRVGDNHVAIDVYKQLIKANSTDREALQQLATLLAGEQRLAELLDVRRALLQLTSDPASRVVLRLEMAELAGALERQSGRADLLRDNLRDQPGHVQSVEALAALLSERGQFLDVTQLLEEQAAALELHDAGRAAHMWARAALLSERDLRDTDRAIGAHRRVVGLHPSADSLRALARIYMDRDKPEKAVPWLESLLGLSNGAERSAVLLQLARAHLENGQRDRAINALETNLAPQSAAVEARRLLADLYRTEARWESLARHLTESLDVLGDDKLAREFATEAAAIYARLDKPELAVPALLSAIKADPENKELKAQLGDGLRAAGRLAEARQLLSELISDFGRRRSPERALLHVGLARVARAEGHTDEALSEMDQAAKMDANNALIQREYAEMARAVGQTEKAEKTYRALLMLVRRNPTTDDEKAVGVAEVLYELYAMATDPAQRAELLQSAKEVAQGSDAEVRRLHRSLLAHGDMDLFIEVASARIAHGGESSSQARLLADLADVWEARGDRHSAFECIMKAIALHPSRMDLQTRARSLAGASKQTKRYVAVVEETADRLRRKDDPPLVAELLMRAGEALEEDSQDPEGAARIYKRVEALGHRLAESFYAQARVAAAMGDTTSQGRALDQMLNLAGGGDRDVSPVQIDALYKLSEIFLAQPARRTQGVELLERAFEAEPRWAAAGRILRGVPPEAMEDARLMALYERVARGGADADLLLDYLERRASALDTSQATIREAVDVAMRADHFARAEALLERAIMLARDSDEGPRSAVWAMIRLAERNLATGQLGRARDRLYDVSALTDGPEVTVLTMQLAARAAAQPQTHALAAEVYELLREKNPTNQDVLRALMALYRSMHDGDRLDRVVTATLPVLEDPSSRTALRLQHASYYLERKQPTAAIEILREALLDNPDSNEAANQLEATLVATGDEAGMADFLANRFEDAKLRGNAGTIVNVAHRLAALWDRSKQADVLAMYQSALIHAPTDRSLLREIAKRLPDTEDPRAAALLLERLLAVEEPERIPALASDLANRWEAAGDDAAVGRTLAVAYDGAPDNQELVSQLEAFYRRTEAWSALAELYLRRAERAEGATKRDLLRSAAGLHRQHLAAPREAAALLRAALSSAPDDLTLLGDLAGALVDAGELEEASEVIGRSIDAAQTGDERAGLLAARAQITGRRGQWEAAIVDLAKAYELSPRAAGLAYKEGLLAYRAVQAQKKDHTGERETVLALAGVHQQSGEVDAAKQLLVEWIGKDSSHPAALSILCALEIESSNWDGVLAAASRLVALTEGAEQVRHAKTALWAAQHAKRLTDVGALLESVYAKQRDNADVRGLLTAYYEGTDMHAALASLLIEDANQLPASQGDAKFAGYKRAAELRLYQVNDPESAAEALGLALALRPDHNALAMMHIDILLNLGRTEEAATSLEATINAQKKRTPELAVMQQRMARVCAALGDGDGQLNWLKKAFDVDRKNAEVAAELAHVATEIGDYELALKPLRAISLMDNPSPVTRPMALLWEAKIEGARGNRAKAELWAKKALREDPSFADAQAYLDELANS